MLKKKLLTFFIVFVILFIVDQYIKFIFVDGFEKKGECISLVLAYNYGVAFSMFSFLEGNLKYIQIAIMLGGIIYLLLNKDVFENYYIPTALLLAGGISNIYDRFIHGGVVDMFYWHGWPYPIWGQNGFAVFNFADVMIDVAVVWLLILNFKPKLCKG